MKRYIYAIQYNESDGEELYDKIWVDALNPKLAINKLKKLYPGVYRFHFVIIEKDLE